MPSTPEARARMARRNLDEAARILDSLKTATGCTDCGYRTHPAALHFDHIDRSTKRRELGWYPDRSRLTTKRRLQAFLAHVTTYCEVRCANCHAVRSVTEQHHLPNTTAAVEHPALY